MGTPAYMAPEQISGSAPNPKSDVYALALVLLEMLTGKRLYTGAPATILRQKLIEDRPPIQPLPVSSANRLFESLITWGLEPKPANRLDTSDFAKGLLKIKRESHPMKAILRLHSSTLKRLWPRLHLQPFKSD